MASIRKREWTTPKGEPRQAWVCDYFDQHGKRRLKTFAKKKDADRWATQALHEVAQGTHTAESTSITVAAACEDWLRRAELEGREPATISQYRQHADLHIKPRIGNLRLAKLTRPGMEKLRDELLEAHSRSMAKKIMQSVTMLLSEAERRGNVARNVARGVKVDIGGRHKRKLRVGVDLPTKQEVAKLLENAEGRWRPLLIVACLCGLRASELRGLPWSNVDLEERKLHVRQRADRFNVIGSPKSSAGEREIPLSPMVVNALREWRLACPKSDLDLVFPNGNGNVENLGNIKRAINPLQVRLGIKNEKAKAKYGMHAFRHFCASFLIDQGFAPKRVQTILGHSSITMTFDTYGHLFPNEQDDFERLEEAERGLRLA